MAPLLLLSQWYCGAHFAASGMVLTKVSWNHERSLTCFGSGLGKEGGGGGGGGTANLQTTQ